MEHPLLIDEAVKEHLRKLEKEAEVWRMVNQTKAARQGLIKRFVMSSESLLKKLVVRQKQMAHSPDEHLVLKTNS